MLNDMNPDAKIRFIPASVPYNLQPGCRSIDIPNQRVAAYCRVSSSDSRQEPSLDIQMSYFTKMIRANRKRWKFAGVYSDVISGRTADRPGLRKLLDKCEKGKIDMVLMKSMSRFTRNTVDALIIVRHLTAIGVDIYFEKENIHTLYMKGELIFSIYTALVQFEGQAISDNTRWGIARCTQDPDSKIYSRPCYGYRRSADGKALEIVEDEAEVVRLIYSLHGSGMGCRRIINHLKECGIPSPTGKHEWSLRSVQRILENEKYRGNVLVYKHFMAEYPEKRKIRNRGQHVQYLVEGHHEAIIKDYRETF